MTCFEPRVSGGIALLFAAGVAQACTVPVFRYGLERWSPDAHVMTVTSNAAPGEVFTADPGHANLWVERARGAQDVPVKVSFPRSDIAWYEGEWDDGLPARLADSPLRRRIAHELLTGTTAAFVMLESSNRATNEAVHAMLVERLDALVQEIELEEEPDYEDEAADWSGPGSGGDLSRIPLRVEFPLHKLARENAAEQFLIQQFEAVNPLLKDAAEVAIGVVFGRGRMILLAGNEVTPDIIDEICWFLCSACSCRVKALNPGVDLLMAANWNEATFAYPEAVVTVLPDGTEFSLGGTGTLHIAAETISVTTVEAPVEGEPATVPTKGSTRQGIVLGVVVLSVVGLVLLLLKGGRA
jgi:hypothetical protein